MNFKLIILAIFFSNSSKLTSHVFPIIVKLVIRFEFCLFSRIAMAFCIKSLFESLFSSYFFSFTEWPFSRYILDNNTQTFLIFKDAFDKLSIILIVLIVGCIFIASIVIIFIILKLKMFCLNSNFRRIMRKYSCCVPRKMGLSKLCRSFRWQAY